MKNRKNIIVTLVFIAVCGFFAVKDATTANAADTVRYINLENEIGEERVSEVSSGTIPVNSSSENYDPSVATFEDGKIKAHSSGICVIQLQKLKGGILTCYISVWYKYPQPKTSRVDKDNVVLRRWGKCDETEGTPVAKGESLVVLARVNDKTAKEGTVAQYVKYGDRYGFISSKENNDRPVHQYYFTLKTGEKGKTGTYDADDNYHKGGKWTKSGKSISLVHGANGSADGSNEIRGESEGTGTVTITSAGEENSMKNGIKTTVFFSVYKQFHDSKGKAVTYSGRTKRDSVVRTGAGDDVRVSSLAQKGRTITVIGECGDYYCLGRNQFLPKKDVDIFPTKFTISYQEISLYPDQTIKLNESVKPDFANKSIKWDSKNSGVAGISNGVVKAGTGGTTTVTGTTINGKTVRCTVKVCVPVTKVTLSSKVLAVEKGKTGKLAVSCHPVSHIYNTIKWESFNNRVASVSGGTVTGKSENTIPVKVTATPLKPTIGKQKAIQKDEAFISVYTKNPKKFYVSPHGADIPQYIAASDKKEYTKSSRIRKNELLSVIGTCGKFYYVEYVKDRTNRIFVQKNMVQQVELLHKELVINQKYTPCSKENKAVKLIRNQTLTDKKKKQKTVYKTSLNFLKGQNLVKADHGLLMAKGRGRCEISIRQTVKKYKKNKLQPKLTKTVYYRLHIVIPENIGALTGYTKKKTEVYQCAGVDCPMEQLSENTKITITGKVVVDGKTVLQIEYKKTDRKGAKKTYQRYANESELSYLYLPSVIMNNRLTGNKVKSISRKIDWHTDTGNKKITKISTTRSIVKANNKRLSHITVSGVKDGNGMKSGYTTVTAEAGRNIAHVPVTVYRPTKYYRGYVKKETRIRGGGSDSKYCPVLGILPKDSKLTIIGQTGNYFYIQTEDKNLGAGARGFVLKDHIVYIDISREYVSINKNKRLEKVKITYFNAINMSIKGINDTIDFYPKKEPALIKKYEKTRNKGKVSQFVRTYYIHPRKEGTAKIGLTKGPLQFHIYVSVYTKVNDIEAFVNRDNTVSLKGVHKDQPSARLSNLSKNTGCKIIGKMGTRWKYVKRGNKKFWLEEDRLTYIALKWYNKSIYRYHSADNYAYLINSSDDRKQTLVVSDKKKVKETLNNSNNAKEIKLFADRPTGKNKPVILTVRYNYGKGVITRKATLAIKDIHIEISPKKKKLAIGRITTKTGSERKITYKFPKINIGASIATLKDKAVSWSVIPEEKAKVVKKHNNIMVEPKKEGRIKVTARYRDIKETANLDVSMIDLKVLKHDFSIENKSFLVVLKDLMDYALEMCDNNVEEANDLVFQYMRNGVYKSFLWESAAGKIETDKVAKLQNRLNNIGYFRKKMYADGFGNKLDMRHLCASIHVITYETSSFKNFMSGLDEEEIDLAGTTVGDLASGIGNYYAYVQMHNTEFSFDNLKKLYHANLDVFPNMSPTDLLEDIDAYNIAQRLKDNKNLTFYDAFTQYYLKGVKQAKADYLAQYSDEEWKQMVGSTLTNRNVEKLIKMGAEHVLGKKVAINKSNYNSKITNAFLESGAEGFKDFINEFYGGYRR